MNLAMYFNKPDFNMIQGAVHGIGAEETFKNHKFRRDVFKSLTQQEFTKLVKTDPEIILDVTPENEHFITDENLKLAVKTKPTVLNYFYNDEIAREIPGTLMKELQVISIIEKPHMIEYINQSDNNFEQLVNIIKRAPKALQYVKDEEMWERLKDQL